MKIALVTGTTRPGNYSKYVAREVKALMTKLHPEVEIMEFAPDKYEIIEGNTEANPNQTWTEVTSQVAGYLIVTPEYNHSVPGSLKMLLDEDFQAYNFKPVGLVGVSDGKWGGVRVIEVLLHTLKALGMIMIRRDAHMPLVKEYFDAEGNITAAPEVVATFEKEVTGLVEHLVWICGVMENQQHP
jgi:NAD(P)H-dependent FMN reductase